MQVNADIAHRWEYDPKMHVKTVVDQHGSYGAGIASSFSTFEMLWL